MVKWLLSTLVCFACALGIYLLTTGLPEKEKAVEGTTFTVPERAVDVAGSEQIYKSMCLSCHGDQLQGNVGPKLAHVGDSMTKEQIYKKISGGGGVMPPLEERLSEDELITVTTWLASHK